MYNLLDDGQNHINIYSKAVTPLGRFLSNFANVPITTVDGYFISIEGYWYWLGSHNETLRALYGYKAKQVGKKLTKTHILTDLDFQRKIREACWIKIHSVPWQLEAFTQSILPFTHYYAYGDKVVDAGYKWLVEMWTQYRTFIKNNYVT